MLSPMEDVRVIRTVTLRLMPFLGICYIAAFIDRVNVSFAALEMQVDLGFSDTVYSLGAGMFFIGYFFFEVPSNVILEKVGARVWVARIMILWGVISSSMMFVESAWAFYALRFLLGAGEAGFFPGIRDRPSGAGRSFRRWRAARAARPRETARSDGRGDRAHHSAACGSGTAVNGTRRLRVRRAASHGAARRNAAAPATTAFATTTGACRVITP